MRISDWSSDVCSSDLIIVTAQRREQNVRDVPMSIDVLGGEKLVNQGIEDVQRLAESLPSLVVGGQGGTFGGVNLTIRGVGSSAGDPAVGYYVDRSEEHTSELQSLMRISYAVFCLKKKKTE